MKIRLSSLFLTASIFVSLNVASETIRPTTSSFAILPDGDIKLLDSDYVKAEKGFSYRQNNNKSDHAGTYTIDDVETLLAKPHDPSLLSAADIEARGKLYSRAGAWHAYVKKDYDAAIQYMRFASGLISDKQDKALNFTQLAYSYERKFAMNNQTKDRLRAMTYIGKALSNLPSKDNDASALLYCLKGKIFQDDHDSLTAQRNFNQAMRIYNKTQSDKVNTFILLQNLFDPRYGMTFIDEKINFMPLSQNANTADAYCDKQLS